MLNRPSRRRLVQQQTRSSHSAVEAAVGELATRARYARYLRGLHAFRAPLEAELSHTDWPKPFGDWRPVMIAAPLAMDIADLGFELCRPMLIQHTSNDVAGLVGCLYVLEGSTLGARVLRGKAQALGYGDGFGARHLAHQAESSDNWHRFLEILEGMGEHDLDRVIRSAQLTFAAARAAFDGMADGDV